MSQQKLQGVQNDSLSFKLQNHFAFGRLRLPSLAAKTQLWYKTLSSTSSTVVLPRSFPAREEIFRVVVVMNLIDISLPGSATKYSIHFKTL